MSSLFYIFLLFILINMKNIAFYVDPFILPTSTFHTIIQFQKELLQQDYRLTIHIPFRKTHITNNIDCYLNFDNYMKDLYEITTIHWTFPIPEDYDALIVSHIWSKKWFNGVNVRDKVVHCFQALRKPTFCLKIDTTLEHRHIKPPLRSRHHHLSSAVHLVWLCNIARLLWRTSFCSWSFI